MKRASGMRLWGLVIVIAGMGGCGAGLDVPACEGTHGEKGKAQFSYVGCRKVDTFFLAAAGAKSSIDVTGAVFVSVKGSDAGVATFTYKGSGGSIDVVAGMPGTTQLSLLDGGGGEIDRVAIITRPTTRLDYDRGWGQALGPTVVAGTRQELHTTTKNGDDVLVGTGAVRFATKGAMKLDTLYQNGDSAAFFAEAGTSTISADATGGGHVDVTVTAIDPATVTSLEIMPKTQDIDRGKSGFTIITFKAGDLPVYGGECSWTFTGPVHAQLFGGSSLSNGPQTIYTFKADAPGTFQATCAVFAGKTLALQLNFK